MNVSWTTSSTERVVLQSPPHICSQSPAVAPIQFGPRLLVVLADSLHEQPVGFGGHGVFAS